MGAPLYPVLHRHRAQAPDIAGAAEGEALRPRRGDRAQIRVREAFYGRETEAGLSIRARESAVEVALRQRRKGEAIGLCALAGAIVAEDGLERRPGTAEAASVAQQLDVREGDGAEQRAPREDNGEGVGDAGQLVGEALYGGVDVEDVVDTALRGLAERLTRVPGERRGVGVDADEETPGAAARALVGESAVAGADVDADAPLVRGEEIGGLTVAEPIEASAAHDDHDGVPS